MAVKPCPHPQHQSADDDEIAEETSTAQGSHVKPSLSPANEWCGAGSDTKFALLKRPFFERQLPKFSANDYRQVIRASTQLSPMALSVFV